MDRGLPRVRGGVRTGQVAQRPTRGIDPLVRLAADPATRVRHMACEEIDRLGAEGGHDLASAAAVVRSRACGDDEQVRVAACSAAGHFAGLDDSLRARLDDPSAVVRLAAASSLVLRDAAEEGTVRVLVESLEKCEGGSPSLSWTAVGDALAKAATPAPEPGPGVCAPGGGPRPGVSRKGGGARSSFRGFLPPEDGCRRSMSRS